MPLTNKQMARVLVDIVEYLALAWQCFDSEPKIDYEKFKTIAGLASAHSARELMRVTKKKLKEEYGALSNGVQDANGGNATPKTLTTASPRKRAAPGTGGAGRKSGGRKSATPAASAAAAATEGSGEEEDCSDGEGVASPSKKQKTKKDSVSPTKKVKAEDEDEGDYFT